MEGLQWAVVFRDENKGRDALVHKSWVPLGLVERPVLSHRRCDPAAD